MTNRDDKTGAYSLDWDGVHIISAGVCAGCDRSYNYSADRMKWFTDDLAKYASDGRPVVIYQHFGFDSFSMSTAWYAASDRITAYWDLWKAIANYNVIGIFHGHSHGQSSHYAYPSTNTLVGTAAPFPLPSTITDSYLPYDIFLPGAGYTQNFAVARVTGHSFEVATTQAGSGFFLPNLGEMTDDYDGSGKVNLNATLSKRLVPGPKDLKQSKLMFATSAQAVGMFTADRTHYLLNIDSSGNYNVWTVDQQSLPVSVVSRGTGLYGAVTAYYDPASGETRALALNYGTVKAYRINKSATGATLENVWQSSVVSGSGFMVYNSGDQHQVAAYQNLAYPDKTSVYLIIDVPGSSFFIYRMGLTGLTLTGSVNNVLSPVWTNSTHLLPYTYSGGNGFIRYSRKVDGPNAEFFKIDDSRAADGILTFTEVATQEQWPTGYAAREIRLPDGSTQILLQRTVSELPPLAEQLYPQSPFYIRTVGPAGTYTDVSWRGLVLPIDATSFAQLGYVNGQANVGVITPAGFAFHFQFGL